MEGKKVKDILLDTGCSRTLIHKDLVPASKIQEDEAVCELTVTTRVKSV